MSTLTIENELAADLIRRYEMTDRDLVIEVGSGEGDLLRALKAAGVRVLGLEPDMHRMSRSWKSGVDTVCAHLGSETVEYIRSHYGLAKVLIARSAKPGSDEFTRLVSTGPRCLAPDGVIAILGSGVNAVVEVRPDTPERRAA
jgi:methylation protein EvaC